MRRHLSVARRLATDPSLPRWLRVLLIFGILPIPGPVDDLALVVGLVILLVFYRAVIATQYAVERLTAIEPLDTWGAWS